MAQASSAPAREPSMEEILASIRRIIEDSDSARRSGDDLQDVGGAGAQADSGAYFDAEDAPVDEAAGHEVEAFRSELVELAPPAAESVSHFNGVHAAANGSGYSHADHVSNNVSSRQPEPREAPKPVRASPMRQHEESEAREDNAGSRGAIISDFAGRQVAAAFEELSEAFSASRKRSYDEIAEEIMRPMLQDWLDNNLPLLVERLVREEIERVARGGVR